MNAKQLANILVKIVGLDMCAHAVPQLVALAWVQLGNVIRAGVSLPMQVNLLTTSIGVPLMSLIIGVFMIISSSVVTNWLFETEPREP
jgi:hypothetical protein